MLTHGKTVYEGSPVSKHSTSSEDHQTSFHGSKDGQSGSDHTSRKVPNSAVPEVAQTSDLTKCELNSHSNEQTNMSLAADAKNSDYVQRILIESETVLAAKQNLLVTGLTPRSPKSWKFHGDVLTNENQPLSGSAENGSADNSDTPMRGTGKTDSVLKESRYTNNIGDKTLVGSNTEPNELQNVSFRPRASEDSPTAHSKECITAGPEQTCVTKNDSDKCALFLANSSSPGERKNSLPASTSDHDNSLTNVIPIEPKYSSKSSEQLRIQKLSANMVEPSVSKITNWKNSENVMIDDTKVQKNNTPPSVNFPVNQNDAASSPSEACVLVGSSMPPPISEGSTGKRQKLGNRLLDAAKKKTNPISVDETDDTSTSHDSLWHGESSVSVPTSDPCPHYNAPDMGKHSRTLTGLLLVPSVSETTKLVKVVVVSPEEHTSRARHDVATMTSPLLVNKFTEEFNAEVQCSLPSPSPKEPDSICEANYRSSPLKCHNCQNQILHSPSASASVDHINTSLRTMTERLSSEEQK
ncbi:unnamed protein product [Echinostoma caproni]|uniref:DBF4-type domain-containing protein n=1 Tax=Echinostoma caproni TaxID=27848 RepID=A0A183BDX5_9TREM|nr:unnamed protein product [Echinostoma caproni]